MLARRDHRLGHLRHRHYLGHLRLAQPVEARHRTRAQHHRGHAADGDALDHRLVHLQSLSNRVACPLPHADARLSAAQALALPPRAAFAVTAPAAGASPPGRWASAGR